MSLGGLWYATCQNGCGFKGRPVNWVPTQVYVPTDLSPTCEIVGTEQHSGPSNRTEGQNRTKQNKTKQHGTKQNKTNKQTIGSNRGEVGEQIREKQFNAVLTGQA